MRTTPARRAATRGEEAPLPPPSHCVCGGGGGVMINQGVRFSF